MFSLNEQGQVNGAAGGGGGGGGGGLANDEEMPEQHELGEELAFTGRWVRGRLERERNIAFSCFNFTRVKMVVVVTC